MDQSFKKYERLKSSERISKVYSKGQKVKQGFLLLFFLPSELEHHRIAIAVPKRKIASAPKRNRVKRLLREHYRLNKDCLTKEGSYDFVLLFLGGEAPENKQLEKAYQKLWEKWHNRVPL